MQYQLFDALRSEEYAALEADILKRGVMVPIEVDQDGEILDGHHRTAIAKKHGLKYKTIVRKFKTEAEKTEHVIMLNMARRHLEPWQWGRAFKRLLNAKGVERGQGKRNDNLTSDTVSEVAGKLGVDDRTARRRMNAADDFDALPKADQKAVVEKSTTVNKAKKKQADKKKKQKLAKKAKAVEDEPADWHIACCDCLDELAKMDDGYARLIFADPPYNQGIDYGDGAKADKLPVSQYMLWACDWLAECERVLTPDGSLWVMIDDAHVANYVIEIEELGLTIRSWIKWYETFGVNCTNNFNRCSRHIIYCVKDKNNFVFNADAVNRPSDRQAKYGDKRADPDGKIWDDVWVVPRLVGTAKERLPGFPTQVPLEITRAIVGCASDPGDMVVDPFSGSASTGVAAIESGRRFFGIEKGEHYCELSKQRMSTTRCA